MDHLRIISQKEKAMLFRSLWRTIRNLLWAALSRKPARYRPEQHYMRGFGPQWRAKHAFARKTAALRNADRRFG